MQNTLFLGIVLLALHLARNARAGTRYLIAVTGLVKLLLPPFLPIHLAAESGAPFPALSGVSYLTLSGLASPAEGPIAASQPAQVLTHAGGLFVVWALIACAYLILATVSTLRLMILLRTAIPPGTGEMRRGSEPQLKIFKSGRIPAPLILALFPRRLYVPASWDRWPEACRQAALQHEIAHARRHDGMFRLLQVVVQAVYFFHPLVWLLNRMISEYREMACDDASVARNRVPSDEYSLRLLRIAEPVSDHSSRFRAAAALFGSKSELLKRINYQMKEDEMHRVPKRTSRLIVASLIIFILPLSWYCGEANTDAKQVESPQNIVSEIPECFDRIEVYTCCGKIEVDGKPTEFADLAGTLENKTGNPDSTIIVIRADNETHMGTVYDIQLVLVDLGLLKVVYEGMAGEGLPLRLPVKKDGGRPGDLPERNLAVIYLDKSGGVSVRGERLESSKLGARVKAELAENEFVVFSIQTERDASFEEFLEVLGETKKAGATRIAIDRPL